MTDMLTTQLLAADLSGVPFFVKDEAQTSSGRKIVLHEYVNSSTRFIEDLGQMSPKFTLTAFVHGVDFIDNARRLESVLNSEGPQILTMPILGSFKVYCLPFRKNASHRSVGEIEFSLEFAVGRPGAGPVAAIADVQGVFAMADEARQIIATEVEFIPATTAVDNTIFASDLEVSASAPAESVNDLVSTEDLTKIVKLTETVTRQASKFAADVEQIGRAFVVYGAAEGIWQAVSIAATRSGFGQYSTALSRMISLTKFGAGSVFRVLETSRAFSDDGGIPLWPETTAQRINRNKNREAIANLNRLNALIVSYEIASKKTYSTTDEINATKESLEAAHSSIMWDSTSDRLLVQSNPNVREAVEDLRSTSLNVIGQKIQEAKVTTTINKNYKTPVFVEAFSHYSDEFISSEELEEQTNNLRRLNPDRPAMSLFGETKIFRT